MALDIEAGSATADVLDAIDADSRAGTIADFEAAFMRFPDLCNGIRLLAGGDGFPEDRYTLLSANSNGNENHFQGLERLERGRYLVLSGGDWRTPTSHLFILRMGSQPEHGQWASNLDANGRPPTEDRLVGGVSVDRRLWHAGGMDTCGHILAVPVEYAAVGGFERFLLRLRGIKLPDNGKHDLSAVTFFYMADPERPVRLPCRVERTGLKATAVALTRLPGQHYLLAILCQPEKQRLRLDFHLSDTPRIADGFTRPPATLFLSAAEFPHYQALNFVRQRDDRLFLVALHNTSDKAPFERGDNEVAVYRVETGDLSQTAPGVAPRVPSLSLIARRRFDAGDACNMDAGAGIHIEGDDILIYSAYHWRTPAGLVSLAQFAPPVAP